ncbi:MAG TPA: SIS domain-containing protein [Stellaceae bacterium]|nr:SIS domain-containing protein [Stellaceae bacterium]
MIFPDQKFSGVGAYLDAYAAEVGRALASVDRAALDSAARLLIETVEKDGQIFACGNGGSAAISNHLHCDFAKGMSTHTNLRPRVQSLSTGVEIITAIANDIEYAEIFAFQLSRAARSGDALIAISSSGNSENVCRALRWARDNRVATIALTGFDGGTAMTLADIGIHVAADNYGVSEDVHQSLMHVLAQFIRHAVIEDGHLGRVRF